MARLHIRPLYNFALILALCASIALLLLSYSHFWAMPQAAEIPSASGRTGQLPLLW